MISLTNKILWIKMKVEEDIIKGRSEEYAKESAVQTLRFLQISGISISIKPFLDRNLSYTAKKINRINKIKLLKS